MDVRIHSDPGAVSSRDALIDAILAFCAGDDLLARDDVRQALEREIDAAGTAALTALRTRLSADTGWEYYPPDPLARRIHHVLADRFLTADSRIDGADALAPVTSSPVILFANHLSYSDANVIETLLHRNGWTALADRLTAIAGPKVFTSRQRRFSSLCFGTVKVPQSTEVSSEEAVLSPREVARAARRALDVSRERVLAGDALLLFGEGRRSRTGGMQSLLPGVARYLELADVWVVPVGLTGSESLFPVEHSRLTPSSAAVRIGQPIRGDTLLAGADRDRRLVVDAIGLAIASLLPTPYRGVYADRDRFTEAAALLDASATAPASRHVP